MIRRNIFTAPVLFLIISISDFDPDAMDQLENGKPEHVPLSYVLRFNGVGDGGGDNGGISCADIDIEKAAAVNFTAEEPVKADIPCCDRVARVATRLEMPSIAPVIFNRNNIMQRDLFVAL